MSVLKVRDLKKTYRKGFIPRPVEVLKGVSFSVEPGTITGFLGGNGAGKTTTMKCLLGLAYPDSGEVHYFGKSQLTSAVKQRIGFLPERPYFYEYLTGEEFLEFYAQLGTSLPRQQIRDRITDLLKRVDLSHARHQRLREYSKGMLQKIGLAQALIHNPELVILDEPMGGLDPDGRFYLAEIIKETAREGTAVFFSSHLLNDAEKLCQNLVILKDGVVIYEGRTSEILNRVGGQTQIVYRQNGELKEETLGSPEQVQKKLQELLSQGVNIDEVRAQRLSLEEAFVEMALKGRKR